MKLRKSFLTVQCSGGYAKTLEVIEYIGLNTLQTGLGDVYKRQFQCRVRAFLIGKAQARFLIQTILPT